MDRDMIYREEFARDGFFVWRDLLPGDLIDQHLHEFVSLNERLEVRPGDDFHGYTNEKQALVKRARYDFHRENEAAQALIFNDDLQAFLQSCFGEEPVMRQPETGLYHRRTPDHTDSLDFKISPLGDEVRVWCALEDIDPDSGPVYFVAGSHSAISADLEREVLTEHPEFCALLRSQLQATTPTEFFTVTRPLWSYVKQQKLPGAIVEKGLTRDPVPLKKGDAVVFRSDVVHGTCRCANPSLTRKYFVSFWATAPAIWYHSRSYWGPLHDYRHPRNAIGAPVERTPHGLRMSFEDLHAAYLASFEKPVYQDG